MMLPKLTLFGRSILLITCEILANAICWMIAGILFGRDADTRPVLSLVLLAWTLGLRHALDADHISKSFYLANLTISVESAIDNATRGLIGLGQLPVTCGLFFSLGHSTIVIVIIVAIAISSDIYARLHGVGDVGGIVGAAISGSFLFIIGLANTIILWRILERRRRDKTREQCRANGEVVPEDVAHNTKENHMFMMRILGPIITFVNRSWKMYPVGLLFGLGFDTASSVALLAVSAIAKKGPNGTSISNSQIIVLPLIFTAGMTLIDSTDSILMLYSYSGFPEHSLFIFSRPGDPETAKGHARNETYTPELAKTSGNKGGDAQNYPQGRKDNDQNGLLEEAPSPAQPVVSEEHTLARDMRVKLNMMSGLSIILTLMSILVAFSISLITIMGLIGEQCASCVKAAEADGGHGGGLSGKWWRGWARANDQSGYIGAAIVGGFLLVVVGWYGGQWASNKLKAMR